MIEPWIQTYTGRKFWPLEPKPEDVRITDIAHALSMKCRFTGHTKKFYSVAEHCIHVADIVGGRDGLRALLHDAAEAYLPDVAKPIKDLICGFRAIEEKVIAAVFERFGVADEQEPNIIKWADNIMLHTEASKLIDRSGIWVKPSLVSGMQIECWPPSIAEQRFHDRFIELTVRTNGVLS